MLIDLLLEDMPNLKNYLPTAIENIYSRAAELATVESGTDSFPSICPYTEEQLLDTNFCP